MKDHPTPNWTSLATSVRPLAVILYTIFQIYRPHISVTSRHKCTKFEQLIVRDIFSNCIILAHSVRLYNAKTFSDTQSRISESKYRTVTKFSF